MTLTRTTTLRRKTALTSTTPLNRAARRRATSCKPRRRTGEAHGRRAVKARSGGICEICGNEPGQEWHHRKNRSQGGTWAPSNGLHACRRCHRRVTDGTCPEYYTVGWCVKRDDDPREVPVQIHIAGVSGLYLLDDQGDYTEAYSNFGLDEAV